jgi:DNA-binding FadR family transcriptional regulator
MAVVRTTVSSAVHDSVRAEILAGGLQPGDPVESERALSERFSVNRQAVREAVKRLEQAGLVQVSHGGPTRVRDWRVSGGLELLTDLPISGDVIDTTTLRAILEMRACIGADAARRCAERGSQVAPQLAADVETAAEAAASGDDVALMNAYAELWTHIVDGAGNIAYRLSLNSLVAGLDQVPDQAPLFASEWHDEVAQRRLVGAIADGDADTAERTARQLLERNIS